MKKTEASGRKSPPFKRRVKDALDAAREAGYPRVEVTAPDGAKFSFNANVSGPAADTPGDGDEPNDFDTKPPRGKRL
jgi:hypothetical protein